MRSGLNLSFLRKARLPRMRPADQAPAHENGSGGISHLSRRDLLRLAGAVTVGAKVAPTLRSWGLTRFGSVEITGTDDRVAFVLEGRERFVIDVRRFAGQPALRVDRQDDSVRIALSGALYPGTDLPADMVCLVRQGPKGTRLQMKFSLGGLGCEVPLEAWLLGAVTAQSRVRLNANVCDLDDGTALRLTGAARAEFAPNWVTRFSGSEIARLTGFGPDLVSDAAALALLQADDPSILSTPPARRTRITLERQGHTWSLAPALAATANWKVRTSDSPFDVLHIEAGMNKTGQVRRVLVAESGGSDARLFLDFDGGLTGAGGGTLQMPLSRARYAVAFGPGEPQTALMARFHQEPVWAHGAGVSMLLGDAPHASPLELLSQGGRLLKATIAPALLGITAPIKGAVVEPAMGNTGARLTFASTNDRVPPIQPPYELPPEDGGNVIFIPKEPPIIQVPLNLTISVLRPDDLLALKFEFINLKLVTGAGQAAKLVRNQANQPAYVIVHFPPQHIAERSYWEGATPASSETPAAPPVPSRMAGPSRLVFGVPASLTEIPYTLDSLLDWAQYDQSVAPTAAPPPVLIPIHLRHEANARPILTIDDDEDDCNCEPIYPGMFPLPQPQAPQQYHTAIEAPYRVIISPNRFAGWAHATAPVEHDDRVELWHTRLGVKAKDGTVDEESEYYRTIRAIWSPDFNPSGAVAEANPQLPFPNSLTNMDRNELVHLTANFAKANYKPRPVQVERLMLSTMGAWLNVHGHWNTPPDLNVEEWRHRAVMGRDTYVKVVYKGYLFPFGHKASLVKITERKFYPTPDGKQAAYLRTREFVVIREPKKSFPGPGQQYSGRQFPFKTVTLTTLVTPNLDQKTSAGAAIPGASTWAWWLRVAGSDFQFHAVVEDISGQKHELTIPMAFILQSAKDNTTVVGAVATSLAGGDVNRRQRPMRGQKVAFAPHDKPGDTAFETASLTFGLEVPDLSVALPADQPRFYPRLTQAAVRLAAVEQMTRSAAPANIKLHQAFLDSAFDNAANKGHVFAEIVDALPQARFPADMAGGIATPNLDVTGLSRKLGPVGGDLADLVGGTFDPKKFLSDEAKILGGILLKDILEALGLTEGGDDAKVPRLTVRVVYPEVDGKEDTDAVPLGVETKLTWKPQPKDDPLHIFQPASDSKFSLEGRIFTKFENPPDTTFEIKGELTKFKVDLIHPITSFIIVSFKQISFSVKNGESPSVKPSIEKVDFTGPLQFVNKLQDFLKSSGLGGLSIDVQPTGVQASYTLSIPSVQVGMFSLANMSLSAALNLPFDGSPVRLRFGFCSRENPFQLTVSCFGGGGFFAIALGLDGVELLEAALEFGASLSIDLGVASGGVHIMAGIYYKMESGDAQLTGYLRMGGELSVLGLISVSAEFYMSLTYDFPHDKVWGQATLTVKVEVLFFSTSVDLHVERRFKGAAGDPTFADLYAQVDWDEYCEAFA